MLPQSGVKRHPQTTPIYVRGRSTPIGYVQGQTFHKSIRGSTHILQKPQGIAFDRSTLVDAERAGAFFAQVTDGESGTVYRAAIDDIWRYGFPVNRGYGQQVALALTRFSANGAAVAATFENNQAIKAAQPSLLGGWDDTDNDDR